MITGVSFRPGDPQQQQYGQSNGQSSNPVQEAIKVLSLRLPKVVGARATAPTPLLTSQGSAGNRVDSVVNQVLARIFGQGAAPVAAPMIPTKMPGERAPSDEPVSGTMPIEAPPAKSPLVDFQRPTPPLGPGVRADKTPSFVFKDDRWPDLGEIGALTPPVTPEPQNYFMPELPQGPEPPFSI